MVDIYIYTHLNSKFMVHEFFFNYSWKGSLYLYNSLPKLIFPRLVIVIVEHGNNNLGRE
jgi:hypothetical protein